MRANSFGIFFAPAVIVSSWTPGAVAQEPSRLHYEMPAMDLSVALRAIARRTDHQLIADSASIRGKRSNPISGDFTVDQAIEIVIEGLHLDFEIKDRTIFVRPAMRRSMTV
ncbi:STN domain-containing protein [Sphingomonas sp. H39-1-10]|uniref:STN domain-containing protein n=1 Tax=Sphingomonas pollutisoli TaxID=3030829 RepID=UPI0023B9B6A4|nr:STN domain-containing protein [Sphingomonas pollutisoli]MDF0491166.1 STN domain-containing protein [Sphingomonas pollutisoli]